ncbi:TonB family protein [Pedobacter cryoconitis]|uniref:TonB family protein n=1 Tax=Pedobacter cryoconitis TaxID=188932 RepID=A0A127VHF9_9SPHI|nr:M56 family metallopeptidase [Pedobacter cryoconitis]AMQ00764.1 TonB family protein [Pedobacter cryoconitis]
MTWAHYLLQINIYLVIFYAFYRLLLHQETYFVLNRIYLIAAGTLSLIIPFLRPEWFVRQPATQQIKISIDELTMMAQGTVSADHGQYFNLIAFLVWTYLAGALFFLCRLSYQLLTVKKLLHANPKGMAFSFFRKKVIDPTLSELHIIQKHEEIHSRQLHSFDVLFFEFLGALVWFNPIIYAYKTAVKHIHEYLADEEAARFQGDKESYALLLLSQAMGVDQHVLTNSFFNKSMLKNRIIMLNKQPSTKTAILKYGLFLPLFAVTLLFSSAAISKNENLKTVAAEIEAPVSLPEAVLPDFIHSNNQRKIINQTNQWTPLYNYLAKSIKYPVAAYQRKLQGNVQISFTLQNGELKNIGAGTQLGAGCDAEVIRAVSAFEGFKSVDNGKYSFTVAFRLKGATTPLENINIKPLSGYTTLNLITITGESAKNKQIAQTKEEPVYDFVTITTPPSFPGGMENFYKFLGKSVKYPEEAVKNNVEGKVFLSYIVEKDGTLTDIKVVRALGAGTDEEAVRVLKLSPKWIPGYSGKDPVRVKFNLPIGFTLTKEKPKQEDKQKQTGIVAPPANPLYIIDGKNMTGQTDIQNINPNDVESVNVLKGEAAIKQYGEAAKNGVIQITTKKKG